MSARGVSVPVHAGIHPLPVDRILDTHLRKHYLSTISFANGNNELLLRDSNLHGPFS